MHMFEYAAPRSLEAALRVLGECEGKARFLAGGTDLIDQMRQGRYQPSHVIDVKKIPELNQVLVSDTQIHIGAAVPCARLLRNPELVQKLSAVADSARIIGGIQIQSRASLGGNLCNSGPAGDTIPSMMALGGKCGIARLPESPGQGERPPGWLLESPVSVREIAVEDFCTGPGTNVLQPDEILVGLNFPIPSGPWGSHYRRMIPRNEMDIAMVGVGAAVRLTPDLETYESVRIALGAVAPTPRMAVEASEFLVGKRVDDAEALEQAAVLVRQVCAPITDMRGTREYRIHVAGVLAKRVVQAAVARALNQPLSYQPGR